MRDLDDYWAVDDESGLKHPASEMRRDWDGQFRHRTNLDGRHPQLDVKARRDPEALKIVRPRTYAPTPCPYHKPFIGDTNIPAPTNSLTRYAGIGEMTLEGNCGVFIVYPNP